MKELIPRDEYGVFADKSETARADSFYVARVFGKEHKNVLRDIAKITDSKSGLSEEFNQLNFERVKCKDALDELQKVDIGLMVAVPDYQARKEILTAYCEKRYASKVPLADGGDAI